VTTGIPYWAAAVYGLLAAVAIMVGGGLVGPRHAPGRSLHGVLAALGAGFLVALGALGALPEAIEHAGGVRLPLLIAAVALAGVLWLHRFGHAGAHPAPHAPAHDHTHVDDHAAHDHQHAEELSLYDASLAVWGLALHSLLDGVAVSAALASRHEQGLFVAVFVLLHKLPEGAAAAALTYASGGQRDRARRGVMIVALASIVGAFAIVFIEPVLPYALAVTAGVTIGVGLGIASHLLRHHALRALGGMAIGALLFALTELLLHA
jgi:zinc transporter ZupT